MFPAKFCGIVQKIVETAKENGVDVYAVGGFVRDVILGREPKDLDIMVDCEAYGSPGIKFAKLLSKKYALDELATFDEFSTAQLVIDGELVEFIMPRTECYPENSRKPRVKYGSLKWDAMRRDFTVNALFLKLNNENFDNFELIDLTGKGIHDLQHKIIRVTDTAKAETIFTEDPLRILRAVRQSIQLDFKIESKTLAAMAKTAKTIRYLSVERIRGELDKMIIGENFSRACKTLSKINFFREILPEIEGIESESTLKMLDKITSNDLLIRVSAMFQNVKNIDDVDVALKRLHFNNHFVYNVLTILQYQQIIVEEHKMLNDYHIRRIAFGCGGQFDNVLYFAKVRTECDGDTIDDLITRIEELKNKNELYVTEILTGQDIMKHFKIPPGKEVAEMKKLAYRAQLENPYISREEILSYLGTLIISAFTKTLPD